MTNDERADPVDRRNLSNFTVENGKTKHEGLLKVH